MSARLAANSVCGPGCGVSRIACAGTSANRSFFFGTVPAIVREHYDVARRRIAGLVIFIDIPPALDIAALSALGFQVEDDRRHVPLVDRAHQLVLGEIESVLDRLLDGLSQSLMALDVITHRRRRARAI